MDIHAFVPASLCGVASLDTDRNGPSFKSAVEVAETWQHTNAIEWIKLSTENADIWIATDNAPANYSYGGTRLVPSATSDNKVLDQLERLALYESALKNRLINRILEQSGRFSQRESWSAALWGSKVGGARCLIRPRNATTEAILSNPESTQFVETIRPLLRLIGLRLNESSGNIKLTPDFGHYAGVSDLLYEVTEHTLGISRELGGCGGKTHYSSCGVIAALEQLGTLTDTHIPVTLIGSAGAMGTDILNYFLEAGYDNITLCDLKYERDPSLLPAQVPCLLAQAGRFTDECLKRGGLLVATTVGQELENSNWQLIPPGTQFFLAHNFSVPSNEQGKVLMRQLQEQGVYALPGQMLTLGGALTSRLEWFFRQQRTREQLFDKPAAYATIKDALRLLVSEIAQLALDENITPYEAMLAYAERG